SGKDETTLKVMSKMIEIRSFTDNAYPDYVDLADLFKRIQSKEISLLDGLLSNENLEVIEILLKIDDDYVKSIISIEIKIILDDIIQAAMQHEYNGTPSKSDYSQALVNMLKIENLRENSRLVKMQASLLLYVASGDLGEDDVEFMIEGLKYKDLKAEDKRAILAQAVVHNNKEFIDEVRKIDADFLNLDTLQHLLISVQTDPEVIFSIPEFNAFLSSHNYVNELYLRLFDPSRTSNARMKFEKYCAAHNINLPTQISEGQRLATRVSHVFGYNNYKKTPIEITNLSLNSNVEYDLAFEGNTADVSLGYLIDLLSGYSTEFTDEFKMIQNCFSNTQKKLVPNIGMLNYDTIHKHKDNKYSKEADELSLNYKRNEMVYLAAGWEGHSVGITLFEGYLMVCNRGEHGDQKNGIKIYKINDKDKIDSKWILSMANCTSYDEHKKLLQQVINPDAPLIKLPVKGQKHGNCTLANSRSSVAGMLFMLKAKEKGGVENLNSHEIANLRKECMSEYKKFSEYTRQKTFYNLIKEVQSLQGTELNEMKVTKENQAKWSYILVSIRAYLEQHHDKNKPNELARGKILFEILPDQYKEILRKELSASIRSKFNISKKTKG
ncbi:MAG: hypothetical protein AB7V32_06665, partial [Candidatus Berkiella sp.]